MFRYMRHNGGRLLVLFLSMGLLSVTPAQRLLVVSQTRNALGEAAALQLHNVDLDVAQAEPGPLPLSGTHLATSPVLDRQGKGLLLSSGLPWSSLRPDRAAPVAALASFRGAPLAPWPKADNKTAVPWREWAVEVTEDQRTLSNLLLTARIHTADKTAWQGALATRPWPPEGLPMRTQAAGSTLALPAGPRIVLPNGPMNYLVLGAQGAEGPALLFPVDMASGAIGPTQDVGDGSHDRGITHLRGAVLDPDRKRLWILFSALVLGEGGMVPTSWLYSLDSESLAPVGPPLALAGIAVADDRPLTLDASGACWVATVSPGMGTGQISQIHLTEKGPQTAQHWSLVGVENHVRVIPHAQDGDLLVTIDNRVEYWPKGGRQIHNRSFEAPITRARWTDQGPVIAEGNRMHRLTVPACDPEVTVALQEGWAIDFVVLPAAALPAPDSDADGLVDDLELKQQTRPDHPDSDGDGTPDGRDPHPQAPSPRLETPADIVFPYAAVGRRFRAMQILSHEGPDARWEITFDREALPWLQVQPRDARGTGYAYMGVDPERFDPDGITSGSLTVTLTGKRKGNRPGYLAADSPATVHVRVEAPRDPLPRILWLLPESAAASPENPLTQLRGLLGNWPYYFSHITRYGPVSESLTPYSIIMLDAEAAAEGALSQMALLDYLNEGGAVLFLGKQLVGDHYRDLTDFLNPVGIRLDMKSAVTGTFQSDETTAGLHLGATFKITQGCRIMDRQDDPSTVRVRSGDEGEVVFLARAHGYGRIALLASSSPLRNDLLADTAYRKFALDLFYWLSRSGYDVNDRDGDGLLDGVEDKNNNGAVDGAGTAEGETSALDPDSDNDGIPDGMEDTNRNGIVDQGESDPRLADTDGDGTPDGADATPAAWPSD